MNRNEPEEICGENSNNETRNDEKLDPCPHCGLLGNKTQKGPFSSVAQRAAHIYRCQTKSQRVADLESSSDESDSDTAHKQGNL